jgi:hypothetical protein
LTNWNVPTFSITGSWRGSYFNSKGESSGFEAVFLENDGALQGNILDDGAAGEADVNGNFRYPIVTFIKRYRAAGHPPINYEGSMSADGNTISGTWKYKSPRYGFVDGTWIARRFQEGEDLTFETEQEDFAPMEVERELIPVRRTPRKRETERER